MNDKEPNGRVIELNEPQEQTDKVPPDETTEESEKITPKLVKAVIAAVAEYREEYKYTGSVMHPRIVSEWKKLLPDAPERILAMAERQEEHRFALEKMNISSNIRRADWGTIIGFITEMAFGGGAFYLILNGHSEIGVTFVIIAIFLLVGNFTFAQVTRRNELRERQGQIDGRK